jgi:glutamate racemase
LCWALRRLAAAIEARRCAGLAASFCRRYTVRFSACSAPGEIDTWCWLTHTLAAEIFRELLGLPSDLVETGQPVARQTRRLLQAQVLLKPARSAGRVQWRTTGAPSPAAAASPLAGADTSGAAPDQPPDQPSRLRLAA